MPIHDPRPAGDDGRAPQLATKPAPSPSLEQLARDRELDRSSPPTPRPDPFGHRPALPVEEPAPDEGVGAFELPSLSFDDDDDEEVTLVGKMSEELMAARQGYRRKAPPGAAPDDRPDIVVHGEEELDARFVEELLTEEDGDATPKIALVGHGATDRGRKRRVNQDALLLLPHRHVYMVADGMGGHAAGELASALATEVVEEAVDSGTYTGEPNLLWPTEGDELARAVEMASHRIYADATGERHGMGTTVTAVRFVPRRQRVYIAHVGDSRCYRVRDHTMTLLTVDHTLANLAGIPGPEGRQLTRAVGFEGAVEVDLYIDAPKVGDRYLLCSDGLTKMLSDDEVLAVVEQHRNLGRCVQALIDGANDRGGADNIGVVLVQVYPP